MMNSLPESRCVVGEGHWHGWQGGHACCWCVGSCSEDEKKAKCETLSNDLGNDFRKNHDMISASIISTIIISKITYLS